MRLDWVEGVNRCTASFEARAKNPLSSPSLLHLSGQPTRDFFRRESPPRRRKSVRRRLLKGSCVLLLVQRQPVGFRPLSFPGVVPGLPPSLLSSSGVLGGSLPSGSGMVPSCSGAAPSCPGVVPSCPGAAPSCPGIVEPPSGSGRGSSLGGGVVPP